MYMGFDCINRYMSKRNIDQIKTLYEIDPLLLNRDESERVDRYFLSLIEDCREPLSDWMISLETNYENTVEWNKERKSNYHIWKRSVKGKC